MSEKCPHSLTQTCPHDELMDQTYIYPKTLNVQMPCRNCYMKINKVNSQKLVAANLGPVVNQSLVAAPEVPERRAAPPPTPGIRHSPCMQV